MQHKDIIVIGGGSAGMAAAIAAKQNGIDDVLILERDNHLGGILQQCIHNGFGLHVFKQELTGPSFAKRLADQVESLNIDYQLETTVLSISDDKHVTYVNPNQGYVTVQAKAIILACGCYERNRGAISLPGDRVKGVYTAGTAQKYLNIENILVGKKVFILGSGDIGLIMARRMTLEGAHVIGVAELMPYSNGLMRNIVQCLNDYDIPLYLSHTVTKIEGKNHVECITISQVDENRQPIPGTEKQFEVDTLLLSVGLVPDTSLAHSIGITLDPKTKGAIVNNHYETSIDHIYACGNALHVHDLVDFVTMESSLAGKCAANDIKHYPDTKEIIRCGADEGVSYVVPQRIIKHSNEDVILSLRVTQPFNACYLEIYDGNRLVNKIRKNYLLPAEMERIPLSANEVASLESDVRVKVVSL